MPSVSENASDTSREMFSEHTNFHLFHLEVSRIVLELSVYQLRYLGVFESCFIDSPDICEYGEESMNTLALIRSEARRGRRRKRVEITPSRLRLIHPGIFTGWEVRNARRKDLM